MKIFEVNEKIIAIVTIEKAIIFNLIFRLFLKLP